LTHIDTCCGQLVHPSAPAPGRLDSIAAHAGQKDHGVGSSGISGKMKGAVRRAERQCAGDGGGEKEREKRGAEGGKEKRKCVDKRRRGRDVFYRWTAGGQGR
jgi:hypothetical protein